ncbi:MAG: recombinase family protein [Alphaproteobacteria bacterium]|nr:recombinase family protein [Alphaproteobacteria bacterium]
MKKAYFAYTRVSTVKQGERGVSLVEQRSAIEAYAAKNGLAIAKWIEEMETAAHQGRRAFSRMLSEIRAGKAQGLIIHKIDRSARNLRDWADIADLIDRGVDVRFVSDNFDLASTGGRLSADIIAAVSASYIRNLREEVKKGMYGRLKQGLYPWAAPWGYLNQGGGKVKIIDPNTGPLIKQLFERYGSNTVSLRTISRQMYEKGLRTKSGKPLSFTTISAILRNPFYCGVIKLRNKGDTYAGIHEPLISKALYDRVQAIIDGKSAPKAKKHQFLFRQMVNCASCNRRMLTGESQKGHSYYRCHAENCGGMSWSEAKLEQAILNQLRRVRFDFGGQGDVGTSQSTSQPTLTEFADAIYGNRNADREAMRTSLKLRLDQIEARTNKLTDLLIDEAIDRDTYNARKEQLLLERRGLEEQLAHIDERSPFETLLEMFERNNRKLLRYESMTDAEKRELLEIVCSNLAASRESLGITLRTPYQEIITNADPCFSAPVRNDVRTEDIVRLLKKISDTQGGGTGTFN